MGGVAGERDDWNTPLIHCDPNPDEFMDECMDGDELLSDYNASYLTHASYFPQ